MSDNGDDPFESEVASNGEATYTIRQKLDAIVAQLILRSREPDTDPNVNRTVKALAVAHRLGLTRPFLQLLPADDDEWLHVLAITAGLCLVLIDDDELDVDLCRDAGAEILAALWGE